MASDDPFGIYSAPQAAPDPNANFGTQFTKGLDEGNMQAYRQSEVEVNKSRIQEQAALAQVRMQEAQVQGQKIEQQKQNNFFGYMKQYSQAKNPRQRQFFLKGLPDMWGRTFGGQPSEAFTEYLKTADETDKSMWPTLEEYASATDDPAQRAMLMQKLYQTGTYNNYSDVAKGMQDGFKWADDYRKAKMQASSALDRTNAQGQWGVNKAQVQNQGKQDLEDTKGSNKLDQIAATGDQRVRNTQTQNQAKNYASDNMLQGKQIQSDATVKAKMIAAQARAGTDSSNERIAGVKTGSQEKIAAGKNSTSSSNVAANNAARERIAAANNQTKSDIADSNNDSREDIADSNNDTRAAVAAGTNASREKVATGNNQTKVQTTNSTNATRGSVAAGQNASREKVAAGNNASRESIAADNNDTKQDVADTQADSRLDVADAQTQMKLRVADRTSQNQEAIARIRGDVAKDVNAAKISGLKDLQGVKGQQQLDQIDAKGKTATDLQGVKDAGQQKLQGLKDAAAADRTGDSNATREYVAELNAKAQADKFKASVQDKWNHTRFTQFDQLEKYLPDQADRAALWNDGDKVAQRQALATAQSYKAAQFQAKDARDDEKLDLQYKAGDQRDAAFAERQKMDAVRVPIMLQNLANANTRVGQGERRIFKQVDDSVVNKTQKMRDLIGSGARAESLLQGAHVRFRDLNEANLEVTRLIQGSGAIPISRAAQFDLHSVKESLDDLVSKGTGHETLDAPKEQVAIVAQRLTRVKQEMMAYHDQTVNSLIQGKEPVLSPDPVKGHKMAQEMFTAHKLMPNTNYVPQQSLLGGGKGNYDAYQKAGMGGQGNNSANRVVQVPAGEGRSVPVTVQQARRFYQQKVQTDKSRPAGFYQGLFKNLTGEDL